jgi:OOP family OmpA-OmpF porin
MALLTVGLGATWRKTDYKDFYYGRNDDTSQQYDLTVTYGNADKFLLTGIANWGEVEFNQAYRNAATGSSPTPGGPQTATTFDWGTKNTQKNWLVALLADWMATDKLKLTASASWSETNGGVDFWSGSYAGAGGFNGGPLVNYITDNTRTDRYQIKAEYRINKSWSATAGYWYEKYDYEDDQMRGYASYYPYYQNLGGTNNTWNSGAFTNPSYTNNIFFITAKYSFDTPQTPARLAQAPAPAPVARPAPPPPPPAPAPAPAPAPTVQKITLDSKVLFDFDKAVLRPEGKAAIDSQVVGKLAQINKLEVVLVSGHTDPIGTEQYNQKLSERRAETVRDYLVSKGVPKDKIEALGLGEKQLVPGLVCEQKNLKEKIACLQPNRRVEIQAKGETAKP